MPQTLTFPATSFNPAPFPIYPESSIHRSTATPTPTNTATSTPTPTDTATSTPTDTATPTPADTPTPTKAATPVRLNTSTPTSTSTVTPSPPPTHTITPMPTKTAIPPLLAIEKRSTTSDASGVIGADNLITYTIVVTNIGLVIDSNVVVTDVLPIGLDYVVDSAKPKPAGVSPLVWKIGVMLPGQFATIQFVARVTASNLSSIHNVAVVGDNLQSILASGDVTNTFNSTAVVLEEFSAIRELEGVRIRWITSREEDTYGFQVYRGKTDRLSEAKSVTTEIIPAQGRQGGAHYGLFDSAITAGSSAYYWLVETELTGNTIFYGPVNVNVMIRPTIGGRIDVFLPMISR